MITNHNMICRGPAKATSIGPLRSPFPPQSCTPPIPSNVATVGLTQMRRSPSRRRRRPVDRLVHAPRLLVTRSIGRATRPAGFLIVTVHVSSAVTLMDWSSIVCTPVLHTELSVFLLSATCCTLQNTLGRKRW